MPLATVSELADDVMDRLSALSQGKEFLTQQDVEKRVSEGNWDFSNCFMKDVDFSKIPDIENKIKDLGVGDQFMSFDNSTLEGVNFSGVTYLGQMSGSCKNTKFDNVSFEKQDLLLDISNAEFTNCDLDKFYLAGGSTLNNTRFDNCSMKKSCVLVPGKDVSGLTFNQCDLSSAQLRGNMHDSSFNGCNLKEADFGGIDGPSGKDGVPNHAHGQMDNVNFNDCDLSKADMTEADISNSKFDGNNLAGADFSKATISDGTSFRGADLHEAKFDGADASGIDFTGANLDKVSAKSARLVGAKFNDATVTNADFSGSDLAAAKAVNTDFSGTIAPGADVHEMYGERPDTLGNSVIMSSFAAGASASADDKQKMASDKADSVNSPSVAIPTQNGPSL